MEVTVTIDGKNYIASMEENATAQEFLQKLPQEFAMTELNGNEKYVYLDYPLPMDASRPKWVEMGDIMLYGDDCLVIFYKSFEANYSYTRIGHIDGLFGLGDSDVVVKFEL